MILRNVNDILTLDGAGIDSVTLSDMRSQRSQTVNYVYITNGGVKSKIGEFF